MCDSWKKTSKGDLSIDEIDRIFTQLPELDAVRLSGGEPFVRKDIGDIAHLVQCRLRPLVLHITSNGFLTDRIVQFCEDRDRSLPLQLLISVDGVEEKHNRVRGRDIAWRKVMETLHALAPRQRELRLRLSINQTIVDAEGAEHYVKLREVLEPLGVRHQMVMAYDASATYSVESKVDAAPTQIGEFCTFGEFSSAELQRLLDEVAADVEKLPLPERTAKRYYLDGIRSRLLKERADHLSPRCVAASSHMRLFPNGDVPTCQFNSEVLGSLREQPFADVWFSERAEQQRRWVRACAGCWAECEVLPNAIYTGDLFKHALGLDGRRVEQPAPRSEQPPSRKRIGLPLIS